jgi:hypothetical protein
MFRFTIRDVLRLTVFVALAAGCGPKARRDIEIVRGGVKDVNKHAAEIEQATKGENRPAKED